MARDSDRVTECECTQAGYCKRHGVVKTAHWVELCQTQQQYFSAWEAGRGPGQDRVTSDALPQVMRSTDETAALLAICHECGRFNGEYCNAASGGCQSSRKQCWERWLHEKSESSWRWKCPLTDIRAIKRTNLIYHVCPLQSNEVWRHNVQQLIKRWNVFNGRKVVAVSQGDGCHDISEVRREFRYEDISWLPFPNDTQLREVATLLPLLEVIQSTEPLEATFYAHTKGNSTAENTLGAEYWRNQMYRSLLDDVQAVRHNLLQHPVVGTMLMHWQDGQRIPYPTKLARGDWMFAGTFFWFRHDAVFKHQNWRNVPVDRYGAEAWLSCLFRYDQACTLFQPWPVEQYPTPSPYDPRLYHYPIRD